MKPSYSRAELSVNLNFRNILTENQLDATDAVNLINGLLVEWQKEKMLQISLKAAEDEEKRTAAGTTNNSVNEE